MVVHEYIERAVQELFEPFSPDTLPGPYQDAYLSEETEGGKLGRLRMYGEIHSLSRTQPNSRLRRKESLLRTAKVNLHY
jgi:hypothetical protein